MMRRLVLVLLAVLCGAAAHAQDMATLVADRVSIAADTTLIAEGNVQVYFGTTRLRASRISFSRTSNSLIIEGPIIIVDASGTILIADQADLKTDLRNGILKGARLVLDQQLQLAAAQINRVDGRYTQLSRAVASSCQVCAAYPVPIWEIRAARVVHDQQEHQLYFDKAQFRVAGVPVFYIPRLRMPDPTLKRATGFLMPSIRSTSTLGPGVKIPYFIRLGDSRDVTLTPYLSTTATQTVDLRFRQKTQSGDLEFNGAVTSDTLVPGLVRGYLFGAGNFTVGDGYRLSFGLQSVSDAAYLLDYGKAQTDRLRSSVGVTRTRARSYLNAQILQFTSLRPGEDNATLPSVVGEFTLHRRFSPAILGGEGGFQLQSYSLLRTSDADQAGRDTARFTARADWRRNWVLPLGITGSALATWTGDFYKINQDSRFPTTVTRATPVAAAELRWPWAKTTARGVSHVIEPVVQFVYSPNNGNAVPNEDSTLVEFDEGNLFALNRFPGSDATERGLRANIGIGWTRYDPAGWTAGLAIGRVYRDRDLGQFSIGSGLRGRTSDWLMTTQITSGGLSLTDRALFGEDMALTKNELRLTLARERLGLSTSLLWLVADPAENRALDTSEWAMDARYAFSDRWTGQINWLYDHIADRGTSAGVGLQYQSDCVTLDLSLSRRFTSSTSVTPTTDFGLSVGLSGFGGSAKAGVSRRGCR